MKKPVVFGFILFALYFVYACRIGDKVQSQLAETAEADLVASFNKKMQGLKAKLVGKRSIAIESLIEEAVSSRTEDYLLMVLTLYDCSSCVKKGDALLENYYETPVTPLTVVSGVLIENRLIKEVNDYIHDSGSTIVGELGYFPTPFLINYNVKGGIRDVYFIPKIEEEEKLEAFESNLKRLK